MRERDEEMAVVTEIGVFGELGIEDPTKKKVKATEMDALIESAIAQNRDNL